MCEGPPGCCVFGLLCVGDQSSASSATTIGGRERSYCAGQNVSSWTCIYISFLWEYISLSTHTCEKAMICSTWRCLNYRPSFGINLGNANSQTNRILTSYLKERDLYKESWTFGLFQICANFKLCLMLQGWKLRHLSNEVNGLQQPRNLNRRYW